MLSISGKVIYIALAILLLPSCNSIKLAEGKATGEYILVQGHINNQNVESLIKDFNDTPKYQNDIFSCLFGQIDYGKYSYQQIEGFRQMSTDELLKDGFKDILSDRKASILKQLSGEELDVVAKFYKDNYNRLPFLSAYIDSTIVSNIEQMTYNDMKYAAHLFKDTPQGNVLRDYASKYKKDHKKEIENELTAYLNSENEIVNYLEYVLQMYVYTNVYGSYQDIMVEIFDGDMPENQSACNNRVRSAINNHLSFSSINNFAYKRVADAIDNINDARRDVLNSVSLDGVTPKYTPIDAHKISIGQLSMRYDMWPIYKIGEIDNEFSLTGTALSVASFLTGGIMSAAKFAYDIYDANDKGSRQKPYIESFIRDYGKNIKPQCNSYINNILKEFKKAVKNSQNKFKSEFYEAY